METPVNVLCLHGCNQTEEVFRGLLRHFIKLGEKQYNLKFHFIEAKYDCLQGGKTWYNRQLDVAEIGSIPYEYDLVNDTLDDIGKIIKEKNINVLLGFSQGGNVVDTFLGYRDLNNYPNIKCAVILSGYSLVANPKFLRYNPNIPILGVVSDIDTIVLPKFNPTHYQETSLLKHEKGHKIPTRKPQIREILTFMQKT